MDSKFAEIDRVVSRDETAQLLRVSIRTLRRMELAGNAPPRVTLTSRLFGYRASDIQKFLESLSANSSAA